MRFSDCLRHEELASLLAGKLPPETLEVVAEHLERCRDCLSALQALQPGPEPLLSALHPGSAADPILTEPQCQQALARFHAICASYGHANQGELCDLWQTQPNSGFRQSEGPIETLLGNQLGQYQLLEQLGRGGMGIVYRAIHTRLKKVVAVKVLAADWVKHPSAVDRFHREMEAVGKLDHPYLVRAMDAGEVRGVHFLVMEFCDGINFSCLVNRWGCLRIPDACELIRQAAVGLQHAHEHGLVHRDIKPSNLMLTRAGQVKILDLGLALVRDCQAADERLTALGGVMGTFDYMAPEQASDTHSVDTRADIYSLGCTLYCLLTGQPPFKDIGTPLLKMQAHALAPLPSVRERRAEVVEALAEVVERMLAKRPDRRFAVPGEAALTLEPFTAGCNLSRLLSAEVEQEETATKTARENFSPSPMPAQSHEIVQSAGIEQCSNNTLRRRLGRSRTFRLLFFATMAFVIAGAALTVILSSLNPPRPALQSLRFIVRRGADNSRIYYLDLVRNGADQEQDPIDPPVRVPQDDFRLEGKFANATYWYIAWIDTYGKVSVVAHSHGREAEIRYPVRTDRMVPVEPTDPAGVHLLILVSAPALPSEGENLLIRRLQGLGSPPQVLPRRWVGQLRGASEEKEVPLTPELSDYIKEIEERIAPAMELVHVLSLRTEKR